jgi:hypothetical protein
MTIDLKTIDTNKDKTIDAGELITTVLRKPIITDGEFKVLLENPQEFETQAKKGLAEQGFRLGDGAVDCLHVLAEHGHLPHKPAETIKIIGR